MRRAARQLADGAGLARAATLTDSAAAPDGAAHGGRDGRYTRICNWTHWQWEPVGADWPFRDRPERELQQCLEAAARQRPALAGFQVADGLLVALLAEFLRRNQAGDFSAMLGMVVQLEAALVRCRLVETCRPEGEACSRAGKICSMEV